MRNRYDRAPRRRRHARGRRSACAVQSHSTSAIASAMPASHGSRRCGRSCRTSGVGQSHSASATPCTHPTRAYRLPPCEENVPRMRRRAGLAAPATAHGVDGQSHSASVVLHRRDGVWMEGPRQGPRRRRASGRPQRKTTTKRRDRRSRGRRATYRNIPSFGYHYQLSTHETRHGT